MDLTHILHLVHNGCYLAILTLGVYGVFNAVLLWRQIKRRQFRNDAETAEFVDGVRELMHEGRFDEAEELCQQPQNWYKAVPILVQAVLEKRNLTMPKIRQAVAARFTREILTGMETLIASIHIVVKCEPMLGLLGTVVGMIGAFGRIATIEHPSPTDLMADLSVALNATAMGLTSAIPLLLIAHYFQVRLRKFEDAVFEQVQFVLDDLDAAGANEQRAAKQPARAR